VLEKRGLPLLPLPLPARFLGIWKDTNRVLVVEITRKFNYTYFVCFNQPVSPARSLDILCGV
jgi:hypothetical protein